LKRLHNGETGMSLPAIHSSDKYPQTPSSIRSVLTSIKDMERNISDKISKVIDEKLEGMDEVVVELIRCKTDNETLRQKIIDLNKEIYQLKNTLSCYKPLAMGLYRKVDKHTWE
jgi:septal ring factor EnvC (AmiA/AmiB activator)